MVEVSIIIPNYNHSEFLEQRLYSVFNQTFENYEVIILDDASTDHSLQILNTYKDHPKVSHYVINEQNSGSPFKQWCKGFELAKGNYIWIAESDDYCDLDFLNSLLGYNTINSRNLDVIYTQSVDVDEKGNTLENRIEYTNNFQPNLWESDFIINGEDFIKKYIKVKCVIPNASAVIFKKQLITKAVLSSGFLDMRICGDWLFWIAILKTANLGFVSKSLNKFRFHDNVTRKQLNFEKQFLRLYEEKLIRDYLHVNYRLEQKNETKILYRKWFLKNKFSNILSKQFYQVKLKHTSVLYYISKYIKIHNTYKKLLNKFFK